MFSLEAVSKHWYGHGAQPLDEGGYGGDSDRSLCKRLRTNSGNSLVIGDGIVDTDLNWSSHRV